MDPAARLQAGLAVCDNRRARRKTVINDGCPVGHLTGSHSLHRDGLIGLDGVDVHAVRTTLDRSRRYGYGLRQRLEQQPDVDVLARPQSAVLVRKDRLKAHAACALIDDIVDKGERSLSKLLFIVAAERKDIERRRH
jgi:hypothetical protein